jgi:outer membrane protein OmpA-like peptidoglycan-associated protein
MALAQDLAGARDHPLIKRFAGSSIVAYDLKQFDSVEIPTSRFVKFNLTTGKREYAAAPLVAEGRRTRIWYEAPGDTSSLEIFRNYAAELTAQGFSLLYDSSKDPQLGKWNGFLNAHSFNKAPLTTNRSQFVFTGAAMDGINMLSAKRERQGQTTYVQLVSVQWAKPNITYKAQRGAYVALDLVDVGQLTQNMVSVSAADMSNAIASTGRIALYGILFDTGNASLKAESVPALEEIAKLMKSNTSLKLRVVGHTDNQGALDTNIALSKRRAEAVTAALASTHGIAAQRLSAFGVADLAPVASNSAEEGRAKNRRVELVPQ